MYSFGSEHYIAQIKAEIEKIKQAKTLEERKQAHERVGDLARQLRESQIMKAQGLLPPENRYFPRETVYVCPKCKRETPHEGLNYKVSGKGKKKKKVPWCPFCRIKVFPKGEDPKGPVIAPLNSVLSPTFIKDGGR